MTTLFYDAVTPANIPAGSDACLYYDGDYAATPEDAKRFKQVRWITVLGDFYDCGIADYEAGNEVYSQPGALRDWVQGRIQAGHRARVYCNRASLPIVRTLLSGIDTYQVWVSTLDGDHLNPTWTAGLWAVQYAGGPTAAYDTSVLYGTW